MLRERLDGHGAHAPLGGLERGGWRRAFTDEPSAAVKEAESADGTHNFLYSLGLTIDGNGEVTEVYWDSVAFRAGIGPEMKLVAVNGKAYSDGRLRDAIRASQADAKQPVELLVRSADTFRSVRLDYHDGLRYPQLQRIEGAPDRLSDILKPRTGPSRPKP
jgi:predicted metalloprotease with PDZ domain